MYYHIGIHSNFKRQGIVKRRKRWGCLAVILLFTIVAAVFGLHWAWKYYGLPEWPDRREYKTIEERAEKALAFARRHNMNEHYALFVDYGIPSGTPRLFVWDFHQKKIVASTYVMHGPGGGSTAERPVFSNKPGSECSSLGRFLVTKEHGYTLKRSFRIKGLDMDNQRASCQGCVTISSRGMNYLWSLVNQEQKPLLLWNFCNSKGEAK